MSTKTVYSIRISTELRKMIDEIKEINWQKEIRDLVEEYIKNRSKEKFLSEARKLRKNMKIQVDAAGIIREDRDAR